jgi:hypothetical protein
LSCQECVDCQRSYENNLRKSCDDGATCAPISMLAVKRNSMLETRLLDATFSGRKELLAPTRVLFRDGAGFRRSLCSAEA